jgi:hypothetical protein
VIWSTSGGVRYLEHEHEPCFLRAVDIGCVALDSAKLICERSILDCDPPEFEDPSDDERGGVSPPELEVKVLERERAVGAGLVNTGTEQSRIKN